MQVFHYSCLPGINAYSLCVRVRCICLTIIITHSLLLYVCAVRPDKAATLWCLCIFGVYSKCILKQFIVFIIMALNLYCMIYLPSLSVSLLRKHMQCFSLHCLSFLFTHFASFCGLQFSISSPVYLV